MMFIRKEIKACLAIYALLLIPFLTYAQEGEGEDGLSKDTFIVVKEYQPVLSDAYKLGHNPVIKDTFKVETKLSYSFVNRQVPVQFELEPIKPARIKGEPLVKLYNGYAKAGIGTNTTPLLELYYNTKRSREHLLGVSARHFSSNGSAKIDHDDYSENNITLFGKKFFRDYTLSGKASYDLNTVHFYGFSPESNVNLTDRESIRQRYNLINGEVGFANNPGDSSDIRHDYQLDYFYTSDSYSTLENQVVLDAGLSKYINDELYKLDFGVDYNGTRSRIDTNSSTIVKIKPGISTIGEKWRLDVGLGIYPVIANNTARFHFYPSAEFKYNVVGDVIIPYLGLTGGMQRNNFRLLSGDNPFIDPDIGIKNTNKKYEAYVGIRGAVSSKLSFNTSYRRFSYEDMPLYVVNTADAFGNKFAAVYDTLTITDLRGELVYQSLEKLKLSVRGDYFFYSLRNEEKAWHKPDYRITFNGTYDLKDKIIATADVFVIGARQTRKDTTIQTNNGDLLSHRAEHLPGYVDVNVGLEYRYTKRLSAFINFNNILGNRYYRWENYQVQGFGVLGGLTYSF